MLLFPITHYSYIFARYISTFEMSSLLHPPPWIRRFVILPLSLLHFTFRDLYQGLFCINIVFRSSPTTAIAPVPIIPPATAASPLPTIITVAKAVDEGFAHRWRWHIRFAILFAYIYGLRIATQLIDRFFDGYDDASTRRRR